MGRSAYVLILLTLVISLLHYQLTFSQDSFTLKKFLQEPEKYKGLTKSIMGKYGGSFEGGFWIIYNQMPIKVYYPESKKDFFTSYESPYLGEVLARGVLQADGSLLAKQAHNYDYNYVWYGLSFLVGVGALVFFFKEWKITREGFKENA